MPPNAYSFALAWRWTQAAHNVLPPEVMAQIHPFVPADVPPAMVTHDQPLTAPFSDLRSSSADLPTEQGTTWLQQLPVPPSEPIIIRWADDLALQTTWPIFTRFWNDFCYPASDDVEIFPPSRQWLLRYHHDELFEWGRLQREPTC